MAILASVSCVKEQNVETPANELHFIVNAAEGAPVKSFIDNNLDGTYTPKWSKGDELALFIGTVSDLTSKPTAILSNTADGAAASFEGTVTGVPEEGEFYSFSPASSFEKGYKDGTIGINLKSSQSPSIITIDESCDVLVAKACSYMASLDGMVAIDDLFMKRIFSILKVNLKGVAALNGEEVLSSH